MHIGRVLLVPLLLVLVSTPASGVTLDDVRRSLTAMRGASPLEVRIDSTSLRDDGKKKTRSSGSAGAEDDGVLLRMVHRKSELQPRADRGQHADSSLAPAEVVELMNYAPALLKALDGATLKKASAVVHEGNPVTLFEVIPKRETSSSRFTKFIRSFSDVLLLYVGADGVPVASERKQAVKASLLVIRFEAKSKETQRFMRVGDRLLVTKQHSEIATSGLGQDDSGVDTSTITIVQ